jgi:hypothetical protein
VDVNAEIQVDEPVKLNPIGSEMPRDTNFYSSLTFHLSTLQGARYRLFCSGNKNHGTQDSQVVPHLATN